MTPGETALTRIPQCAYSIANDRVAAATPPLVSEVKTDGTSELAESTRVVVTFTMWPPPLLQHLGDDPLSQSEEPREVDADDECVVFGGVVGERLRHEDTGNVGEGVDATETLECSRLMTRSIVAASEMSPSTVSTPGRRKA